MIETEESITILENDITIDSEEQLISFTIEDISDDIIADIVVDNITIPAEEIISVNTDEETIDFSSSEPNIIHTTTVINNTIISEDDVPYNTEVDFVGDTLIYKGVAEPGTPTTESLWRISKIEFVGADEDVVITWADGDSEFDNIWDNRLSYTYS